MPRIVITIDCDNAAFGETHAEHLEEAQEILSRLANRAPAYLLGNLPGVCRLPLTDTHGNLVGAFIYHP